MAENDLVVRRRELFDNDRSFKYFVLQTPDRSLFWLSLRAKLVCSEKGLPLRLWAEFLKNLVAQPRPIFRRPPVILGVIQESGMEVVNHPFSIQESKAQGERSTH